MPEFDDATTSRASAAQVWKILYDPLRFAEWWAGFDTVTAGDARGGGGDVTVWPVDSPDLPLPQRVQAEERQQRVVVSCTVSDLVFDWQLERTSDETRISVHVEIPEREAARLAAQRDVISSSLRRLAALAEEP